MLITTFSCSSLPTNVDFPYDLRIANDHHILPHELAEISGLCIAGTDTLWCVEDEHGIIYQYGLAEQRIIRTVKFAKSGDFEGIARLDSTFFVLKSNGTIFKVDDNSTIQDKVPAIKIPTFLNDKNDTEGICYDQSNDQLLIVCKGRPGKKGEYKKMKTVYAFDLTRQQLNKKPYLILDVEEIDKLSGQNKSRSLYERFFSPGDRNITFNPSAIAIHPITQDIYVLSSIGNLIVVISRNGELLNAVSFESKVLKQPEGLAFSLAGDMYISNEGRGGKANIKVFSYHHIKSQ